MLLFTFCKTPLLYSKLRYTNKFSSKMSNVYCAACNEPGHLRRTFRGCRMNPLNQANISDAVNQPSNVNDNSINETSNTTRRIRSRNQQPTLNIAKDTTALPTVRDDRGSMDCVCSYCGAMMWIEERAVRSS